MLWCVHKAQATRMARALQAEYWVISRKKILNKTLIIEYLGL